MILACWGSDGSVSSHRPDPTCRAAVQSAISRLVAGDRPQRLRRIRTFYPSFPVDLWHRRGAARFRPTLSRESREGNPVVDAGSTNTFGRTR
jgi:hypothetical protein